LSLYASQKAPVSWQVSTAGFGTDGAVLVTMEPSLNRIAAAPAHCWPGSLTWTSSTAALTSSWSTAMYSTLLVVPWAFPGRTDSRSPQRTAHRRSGS